MMSDSILKSVRLTRAKELLEKDEFDIEGYVTREILSLYELKSDNRPRTAVSYYNLCFPISNYLLSLCHNNDIREKYLKSYIGK